MQVGAVRWIRLLSMLVMAVGCSAGGVDTKPSQPDIRQIGELEYQITRQRVDAALAWLQQPAHARYDFVVPSERDGALVGLKVYGIRPGSLRYAIGLRNGDMIKDVNGIQVFDLDGYQRIRDALQRNGRFVVRLERHDQELTLVVWIVDSQ